MKKTLVLGASTDRTRYSNRAVLLLQGKNNEVVAVGREEGEINGVKILTGQPVLKDIDTVTVYLSAKNQAPLYDYILSLKPKRVIFNPGAENPEFEAILKSKGIEVVEACTLTMLSVGNY